MVLSHGTNRPFLHIIMNHDNCPFLYIHIIHVIIHIFLFQPASANLRAYFLLKPMDICFLHYWPGPPCFKSFDF